jgi:hypothetical protein
MVQAKPSLAICHALRLRFRQRQHGLASLAIGVVPNASTTDAKGQKPE